MVSYLSTFQPFIVLLYAMGVLFRRFSFSHMFECLATSVMQTLLVRLSKVFYLPVKQL